MSHTKLQCVKDHESGDLWQLNNACVTQGLVSHYTAIIIKQLFGIFEDKAYYRLVKTTAL